MFNTPHRFQNFVLSLPPQALTSLIVILVYATANSVQADQELLTTHCAKCHSGEDANGGFRVQSLGEMPSSESFDLWTASLDYVKAGEMPPAEKSVLSKEDRSKLVQFLESGVEQYSAHNGDSTVRPRRLNNRELANSVADVLLIEDVGTHQPMANLLGDALQDGFDTDGDALGLSRFHLEQYIAAFRKIVDATILTGARPETQRYQIRSDNIFMAGRNQNSKRYRTVRNEGSVDFFDMRSRAYFDNFSSVPTSGHYRIRIKAKAMDRGLYDAAKTGIYDDDPIQLRIHLGDRVRDIDLPDDDVITIKLDEWLAEETRLEMTYPTDGLRLRNNGNFKFQYAIAGEHIKETQPKRYASLVARIESGELRRTRRDRPAASWHNWVDFWQGPRPRLYSAEIEGPIYETWPPKRQVALLGDSPTVENALAILRPIAERAWRREIRNEELSATVRLVEARFAGLQDSPDAHVEALKEGIIAILVSPSFLLINTEDIPQHDRFATKLSYFVKSTTPDHELRSIVAAGKLDSFESVRVALQMQLKKRGAEEFLSEFPQAWLQLDRINFMAPDPDRFRLYDRKRISEDMIQEVLHFFRHAVEHNLPVTELLSADYSFINADLAQVYEIPDVAQDSKLRKHVFADGRRGGLLGMGAFLTLTADSLGTSPIHRAVYVMENLLGIHPSPPPADVLIEEPDVRQASTIKEVLQAHTSDETCAACHQRIDPYGYAFENFGPMGEWRDVYTAQGGDTLSRKELQQIAKENRLRNLKGLPLLPKTGGIPIDSSSQFLTGASYNNIVEFRKLMLSPANRDRFVRCFITKLLTYANGCEPDNYLEVSKIVEKSAACDYRIVDTIAAVIDSPLFRE